MMINDFPLNIGLSRTYSTCTITTGKKLDFKKQLWCPFGAYVQSHDDRKVTNQMVDRSQGAICLGSTVNLQGSYEFLSLRTGRNITHSQFTEMLITPRVTRLVIAIVMYEKQQTGLVFEDRNGV